MSSQSRHSVLTVRIHRLPRASTISSSASETAHLTPGTRRTCGSTRSWSSAARLGASSTFCCVIATAVNSDGRREVLGVDIVTSEDGAAWTAFLRGLKARGLTEVKLVISDSHSGLTDAIATVFGGAALHVAALTSRATC